MGTFRVLIKELLDSGASITIHCFCLRTSVWTNDRLRRFPPTLRLWNATQDYRCATCGRIGKVRHIDVHAEPQGEATSPAKREHVRKSIPMKEEPVFGKRRRGPTTA